MVDLWNNSNGKTISNLPMFKVSKKILSWNFSVQLSRNNKPIRGNLPTGFLELLIWYSQVYNNEQELLLFWYFLQISFFSTSPELSNKQRFEYFSRTIPSDHYQTMAMTKIVERLGWKYMSIIYEESNYGIKVCTLIMDHRLVFFVLA